MFSKIFKLVIGVSVFFGLGDLLKRQKKQPSTSRNKLNDFDYLDNASDEFIDTATHSTSQDSVSFVPAQEATHDANNNFNTNQDVEISSPG